jgi:hypothetical protein
LRACRIGRRGRSSKQISPRSAHAGALAALAFDDIVALFYQALALAFLHFCFFLMFGPFSLDMTFSRRSICRITMIQPRVAVYKPWQAVAPFAFKMHR